MGEIFSNSRALQTPTASEIAVGRPVLGRTATTLFSGAVGLHGARLKRIHPMQVQMASQPAFDDSGDAATLRYDFRMPFCTSPYATHLWVGIWVVAQAGQSSPPEIEASIYDSGGGLIDAGVTWSAVEGSLPLAPLQNGGVVRLFGATVGQDDFIETGWDTDAEVADGPRLLNLGDPGTWHELRLSPTGARIYSVTAIEADMGRIPTP